MARIPEVSQSGLMGQQKPNRIAELRHKLRWNQSELAQALGVHKITISKLERGEMQLTQSWMERLGKALNVPAAEVLSDPSLIRSVYVNGAIGKEINVLDTMGAGIQNNLEAVEFELDFGTPVDQLSLFFFVISDNYRPAIGLGDVVRFSTVDLKDRTIDDIIGRICLLERHEPHTLLLGILERGASASTFDLRHIDGTRTVSVSPDRIYVLTMVLALSRLVTDEFGVP